MVNIEKYIEKSDIVEFVQMFDEDFESSQMSNLLLKMVNAKVDTYIIEHGVSPVGVKDKLNLLWSAALTTAIEILCNIGKVTWSTGDIALEKLNKVTYQYQRWQPMFFFASGSSDSFKGLLPHETYRMMAYAYVDAYCREDFFRTYGSPVPIPILSVDRSSRGWGWNTDEDYAEASDEESAAWDSDLLPWEIEE